MKKSISLLIVVFTTNLMFSQFLISGNSTVDNKYRSGAIGLGYTTLPTFGTFKFLVNGNSYFSGNIGLGTSTPASKFQMTTGTLTIGNYFTTVDDVNINWGLKTDRSIVLQSSSTGIYGSIDVQYGTSIIQMAIAKNIGGYSQLSKPYDAVLRGNSTGSFILANERGGDIKFETTADATDGTTSYFTSKTQMLIDKSGNIGIGTGSSVLNPLEKLAVNGLIHTKEVKVDLLNWPDYVFEKNYNLIPLTELENKINTDKHLPEIPSAAEVAENGLLLGEMNKKLLQKVEELTLYMIEMNKEIILLKAQIKN